MGQKKSKKRFMQDIDLRKPLCAAMILCSWLIVTPTAVHAADDVAIAQSVNQQIAVKGTVVDVNGEPVIGASVKVDGGSIGTITDMDGNFSLSVAANAKITVSFVGYQSQTIVAKAGTSLKIVLKEDSELLDEVVVVGYGQVKRANLTGAVSSVKMKDLSDIPATNLTSVLMGTMPGVNVSEATGNPIADAQVQIRTTGSWNSEPPLYVIDGFIRDVAAFNVLDPSEIDNISVLKDAAAAVYGVRGAGGVILVTTKRGKEGKTSINYSGSVGVSQGVSMPEMMSAYQQATALNDLWQESIYSKDDASKYNFFNEEALNDMRGVNYNWLDEAWSSALNTRHTVNVSGGSEKVRYFVGGSYMYADGNFSNLDVNRLSTRIGLDVKFTKELKGTFNMSYSSKNTNMPLNTGDKEPALMYNTFSTLTRMPYWIPAYIDGRPVGNGLKETDPHPLAIFDSGSYRKNKSDDIAMSAKLDYDVKWVKGLSASVSFNYNRSFSNGKTFSKPYTVYVFEKKQYEAADGTYKAGELLTNVLSDTRSLNVSDSYYEDNASYSYSYQLNPQLNYNVKIKNHDISAMYVYEVAESGGNSLGVKATEMIIGGDYDNLKAMNLDKLTGSSGRNNKSRRMSHIGRLNYSYANRYFFEGTIRYEASDIFAPGYRWGTFYSLSGSWRISEENWFKNNVKGVENLKIRASYGRLGSDRANESQWKSYYTNEGTVVLFGNSNKYTGLKPSLSGLSYYNASWEKTDNYNAGIDLALTNGFSFDVDGFYKHTFDILDPATSTFPQSAGVAEKTPKLNYGIQNAWGFEFGLGYQKKLNKDWGINTKANFSFARSKVIKKYQDPGVVGTWKDEEGRMRGGEVGYKVWRGNDGKGDGMARNWEDVRDYIAYLKSHTATGNGEVKVMGYTEDYFRPGMLMYEDMGTTANNRTPDGIVNQDGDQCILGKYDNPPYRYNLNVGFTWKSLSVSALFSGQFGNDVFFEKGFWTDASGGSRSGDFLSITSNQLSEWYGNYAKSNEDGTLINPNAKYPRLDKASLRGERSDFWMRDGHTLRLRTVNVSYTLPKSVLSLVKIESCRVFFTANNVWTIINPYPYKDAYVSYWSDYPQIRTFNFGININL